MKKFKIFTVFVLCISMLLNIVSVYAISFDMSGQIDGEVSDKNTSALKPFVEKAKIVDNQFYLSDNIQTPVFRIKFNEGEGNKVKESISGKEYTIEGNDYEWISDADIRYGGSMPSSLKQKSALRLKNSYINLGNDFAELSSAKGEMTIVFWTNHEIFGRRDDYEEPYYQQYTQVYTSGSYKSAYKYDYNRNNVIMQSDNAKVCFTNNAVWFDGINTQSQKLKLPEAISNNNYYNMYTLVIRKNESGSFVGEIYGNDKPVPQSSIAQTSWGDDTSIFGKNMYLGTPVTDGSFGSMELGIADLMVFDRALSYQDRLELYYGYKQVGYYLDGVRTD